MKFRVDIEAAAIVLVIICLVIIVMSIPDAIDQWFRIGIYERYAK